MDVMPMATMPVAVDRAAPGMMARGAEPDDGFDAALSEVETPPEDSTDGASTTPSMTAGGPGAPKRRGPGADGQGGAVESGLAAALGLSGLVVSRPVALGLETSAGARDRAALDVLAGRLGGGGTALAALTGLGGALTPALRGVQVGLAAQGFAALQAALQGTVAEPDASAEGLAQVTAGGRQDALTQELAHLLAARTGPLPDFGAGESGRHAPEVAPPGATPPAPPPAEVAAVSSAPAGAPPDDAPVTSDEPAQVAAATDADRLSTGPETDRPVEGAAAARSTLFDGAPGEGVTTTGGALTPTVSVPTPTATAPAQAPGYASGTPTLPPGVEAPAVLRQIGDGLKLLTQGNRQSAEIRLDPVELGKVRVRMEIEGKDVRMYVTTENAAVRDVVAQGLDGLRRDLMAQGLQVQHVSVDVQADAHGFGHHRRDEHPEGDAAMGDRPGDEGVAPGTTAGRPRGPRDGKRIDLTA